MPVKVEKLKKGPSFTLLEIFVTLTLLTAVAAIFTHRGIHLLNHYRFEHKLTQLTDEIRLARTYCLTHQLPLDLQLSDTFEPSSTEYTPPMQRKKLAPLKVASASFSIEPSGWIEPTTLTVTGLGQTGTITINLAAVPAISCQVQ